jgi:hypothetical protein
MGRDVDLPAPGLEQLADDAERELALELPAARGAHLEPRRLRPPP